MQLIDAARKADYRKSRKQEGKETESLTKASGSTEPATTFSKAAFVERQKNATREQTKNRIIFILDSWNHKSFKFILLLVLLQNNYLKFFSCPRIVLHVKLSRSICHKYNHNLRFLALPMQDFR